MPVHVLLVEDNAADASYIERKLASAETSFKVSRAEWLATALQVVATSTPDVVLLDLSLPDSQGVDTVVAFVQQSPEIPLIVLTGHDDTASAMNAVRVGAQDYLIKGEIQARHLERTVLLAIERKRVDLVGKRFLHNSLSMLMEGHTDTGSASVALLGDHLAQVARAQDSIMEYLRKNAPAHLASIEAIWEAYDIPVVLREVRDILNVGTSRGRKSLSAVAEESVAHVTSRSEMPSDAPAAQRSIMDVIANRERYSYG